MVDLSVLKEWVEFVYFGLFLLVALIGVIIATRQQIKNNRELSEGTLKELEAHKEEYRRDKDALRLELKDDFRQVKDDFSEVRTRLDSLINKLL